MSRGSSSLVSLFRRIRDRIAATDASVNRDEEILPDLSALLLLKILDEQRAGERPASLPRFEAGPSPRATARSMRKRLAQEAAANPQLFGVRPNARFQIANESVHFVVDALADRSLLGDERDAVAEAFQVIRGKAYKGEEGQYFTPPSVVQVVVAAIDLSPGDRIIDPACGSGAFLAAALARVEAHPFAIDKDAVSVRLAKAYLSMLGEGADRVFQADAVRPSTWEGPIRKQVADGGFDAVLTNPPFGKKLAIRPDAGRAEGYALSEEWKQEDGEWHPTGKYVDLPLGLAFLERNLRLLKDGGRLAIVLPDTYLFSPTYGWVRQWLSQFTITHSINVPIEAFEPHCRAKTSVLVIRKSVPRRDHRIVGSLCATCGETKHGAPLFKWVDGEATAERDDEMTRTAALLASRPRQAGPLHFRFSQAEAMRRGVLVAQYWWRKPYREALEAFASEHDCELVTAGELAKAGELQVGPGHGSPPAASRTGGTVPYVKVSHLHGWRVFENPKHLLPESVAAKLRRGRQLEPYDLVTPTRSCRTIGLFAVVMPWQTRVVLTREIAVWRTAPSCRISRWLLLALLSLKVVHDQFRYLVLMQTNREDLGERWRELKLPVPRDRPRREAWEAPVREYFEAQSRVREKYDALADVLDPTLFVTRP